jgi:hypothetical protein
MWVTSPWVTSPDVQWDIDSAYADAIDMEVGLMQSTECIEYLESIVKFPIWDEIVSVLDSNAIELDISTEPIESLEDIVDYKLWDKIVAALERVAQEWLEANRD